MHNREQVPPYQANTVVMRLKNLEANMGKGAHHVRVDVSDFYGKLDPYAFQDWITSLNDYFDWFGMSANRKMRFVKMKLKGHARVLWQGVEEQLYCTHQPPIAKWEEMWLKL